MQTPLIVFRLLVAAAWSDGELHPAEALLLAGYLQKLGLSESENQTQITYLRERPAADTSQLWFSQLQKAHPTAQQQKAALSAVQNILRADGQVVEAEAQLLNLLHAALEEESETWLGHLKNWLRLLAKNWN